jgi:hypothetical protein
LVHNGYSFSERHQNIKALSKTIRLLKFTSAPAAGWPPQLTHISIQHLNHNKTQPGQARFGEGTTSTTSTTGTPAGSPAKAAAPTKKAKEQTRPGNATPTQCQRNAAPKRHQRPPAASRRSAHRAAAPGRTTINPGGD